MKTEDILKNIKGDMRKKRINNIGIIFLILTVIIGTITIFQVGFLNFSLIMLTETFMAIGVLSYAYGNET